MTDRPTIKPTENGPYRLEGASEIVRMRDGEAIALKPKAFLCRCGGSQKKPFCDGTHARIGFSGARDPDRVRIGASRTPAAAARSPSTTTVACVRMPRAAATSWPPSSAPAASRGSTPTGLRPRRSPPSLRAAPRAP